jgi:hypothetical protein
MWANWFGSRTRTVQIGCKALPAYPVGGANESANDCAQIGAHDFPLVCVKQR